MKKEVFLAVLVGFSLGLIITFGIWTANKNLKPSSSTAAQNATPSPKSNPDADTNPADSSQVVLTLTAPEQDETLVNTSKYTVSGKTQPGNSVAITHENGQEIIVADSSGNFFFDITLEGGYNRISISAFNSQGKSNSKEVMITYTTAQF